MIQKEIREHNQITYTVTEGADLIEELNQRTEHNVDGYNSIAELGPKVRNNETGLAEAAASIISLEANQVDGVLRYNTLLDLQAIPSPSATSVYKVTADPGNNGFYSYNGSNFDFEGSDLSTQFDATNEVDGATMSAIGQGFKEELYEYGKNLFNRNGPVTDSTGLTAQGVETSNVNSVLTPYIELSEGVAYAYQGGKGGGHYNAIYDDQKVFTRRPPTTNAEKEGVFTLNPGEKYVRFTMYKPDIGAFQLEVGNTTSVLEPYYERLKAEHCKDSGWWDHLPDNAELVLINLGQSNAKGYLNINAEDPPPSDGAETEALKVWDSVTQTFKNQIKGTSGFAGYDMPLQQIVGKYRRQFNIIHGAQGGTNILYHLPGGSVYETAWQDIQDGINHLLNNGKRPFVWLTFVQGEADTIDQQIVDAYAARSQTWVDNWRTLLGQKLPIIMGGINPLGTAQEQIWDEAINAVKRRQYADGVIDAYYEVTGLEHQPDNLHRSYQGLKDEAKLLIAIFDKLGSGLEITNTLPYTF
jgi:hypothetical protein